MKSTNYVHGPPPGEFTWAALILGIVLSVVMGAANVYLGLRAGMTVSASIPAAVISMGLLGGVLRRDSLLESNLVQTAASAGESLAAGIIFTMPALILTGIWDKFDYWTVTLIALAGGWLGVLLMVPMRRVFVVDNDELSFPEGLACAEVLKAGKVSDGEAGRSGARLVFGGVAIGGLFKFAETFLGLFRGRVDWATLRAGHVFYAGMDISPALISVGIIVGLPISLQVFLGGAIGWIVTMPLLDGSAAAGAAPVDQAFTLWSEQIRFVGVGAMVVGGIVSIWRVRRGLVTAVGELAGKIRPQSDGETTDSRNRDLSGKVLAAFTVLCIVLIGAVYYRVLDHAAGLTLLVVIVMFVMAFFFTAVASYIVGLVGNSNSPVSGMTITAVLGTAAMVYLFGYHGRQAILATLGVAGVVCCVACTSGDVCNDLKTGLLVGASPRRQQMMQLIGVLAGALVMAPVLTVLHEGNADTGGIGGQALPAPQAGLFATLVEGFFGDGQLPWDMIAWGAVLGVVLVVVDRLLAARRADFRLHVMPVAVGIYLPFGLATAILTGGLLAAWLARKNRTPGESTAATKRGVLIASGMIAGESLVGVFLAGLAYLSVPNLGLAATLGLGEAAVSTLSLAAIVGVCAWLLVQAFHESEA